MKISYIEAWGKVTNQRYDVTAETEIKAILERAPETAVFKGMQGNWITYEDLSKEAQQKIDKVLDGQ